MPQTLVCLPNNLKNAQKNNPNTSFISIMQTTKDGKFRGINTWEHNVQAVIETTKSKAIAGKNRFGAKGEVEIF